MEELIEKIKKSKPGERATLICSDIFGNLYEERVTIASEVYQYGYANEYGSWGLYSGSEGFNPCYKVDARPYQKRTVYAYKIGPKVKDIRPGW
ncbi:hypothetical protein ACTFSJ_27560 [Bacillus cereus group sp. MYBK12-2]|uniref:hypothetical protein n=1 Tax=Bacillus cereus group sp. MYBK12-2 TaxID=3450689 RepID=UPI0032F7A1F7|nr:hypothetical protein [Bacillus pacificus]HDR7653566.1 hypothetical protein [Bacillus pacificus]